MFKKIVFLALFLSMNFALAEARDQIRIVGSSPVLPFIHAVAESFSNTWNYPAPHLEVTGSGKGFKLFGAGVGYQHPDILVTPRAITEGEFEYCRKNGVEKITEIPFGKEAIVVAYSSGGENIDISVAQLYKALAEQVPGDNGKLAENAYTDWSQIDPKLPGSKIKIMGPPNGSSVQDVLLEKVMAEGCFGVNDGKKLSDQQRFRLCNFFRDDKAFEHGMKNESSIVRWLDKNPDAYAILSFSIFTHYSGKFSACKINGVAPTVENITANKYPLARPIYLYLKTRHVEEIDGLQQFVYEAAGERTIGPEGYLVEKGFVPLDDIGRNRARDLSLSLETIE